MGKFPDFLQLAKSPCPPLHVFINRDIIQKNEYLFLKTGWPVGRISIISKEKVLNHISFQIVIKGLGNFYMDKFTGL